MRSAGGGGAPLRLVEADALPAVLAEALAGGRPVAPLPPAPLERAQALAMLAPAEPLERDAAVVVSTSGSTGRPKGVLLSAAAIRAAATASHQALGGPGDWALALPPHYVAGLMVLARAELAGTRAHPVAADLRDLPAVVTRMRGRRYLSLVPTQLARALPQPALAEALQAFDAVLVGGGALPEALAVRARAAGVPVVRTYGMSETCGGCVYDGAPLPGVDVRVAPEGRISLAGPMLFSGYRRRPDLTAAALVAGRLLTADRGRWTGGRLQVLGRLDDVVVSGGMNVDLGEVEREVRGWPELGGAEVAVVGVPDAVWGTAVVVVAERAPWPDGAEQRLREHLRARLPAYAAPRRLLARTPLPRTSSGKIDRLQLVADLPGDEEQTRGP